jgi:hypothetical protein
MAHLVLLERVSGYLRLAGDSVSWLERRMRSNTPENSSWTFPLPAVELNHFMTQFFYWSAGPVAFVGPKGPR